MRTLKDLLPYIIIAAAFFIFLVIAYPQIFTYKFNSGEVGDYLRSQDIEDPKGLIKDRIFISDNEIYQATGYLYATGTDPASLNLHPPAIKYFFGFSTLATGNPFYVQIAFGLVFLILTYFLGIKLFNNHFIAGAGTLLLLIDPVFGGMMNETLLDLGQAVFALMYVALAFFNPGSYILSGVVLGLFASSKFWSTALIFVFLVYGYKLLIRKEKVNFKKLLVSFLIALLVFALTYVVSFIKTGGVFNLFAYQARVLKFMLTHNSGVSVGGPLILFLLGTFRSWWGGGLIKADLWSFLWPVGLIGSVFLALRTKIMDIKFFFYIFPLTFLLLESTQVPFTRYFILVLPFIYLSLGSLLFNLLKMGIHSYKSSKVKV